MPRDDPQSGRKHTLCSRCKHSKTCEGSESNIIECGIWEAKK